MHSRDHRGLEEIKGQVIWDVDLVGMLEKGLARSTAYMSQSVPFGFGDRYVSLTLFYLAPDIAQDSCSASLCEAQFC